MNHPAKYSPPIIDAATKILYHYIPPGSLVLDPFAGTVQADNLMLWPTVAVELEPEWATGIVGDANWLPFKDNAFPVCFTSPPYGNRMADQDMRPSVAGTYAKSLGRRVSTGSVAGMQWGPKYKTVMHYALGEIKRVLQPGGLFLLNVSDHIRDGKIQGVPGWFLMDACFEHDFYLLDSIQIKTKRLKRGANSGARVDHECLFVLEKML